MKSVEPDQDQEIGLEQARDRIWDAIRGLKFGSVEIQIHDCRIVRITRTERVRVEPSPGHSRSR
ncbi:MAG TPA: YezD family protein [Polyangiaceae bacterium]|nr:YezD family protein [Polyangiaceae bacterium]